MYNTEYNINVMYIITLYYLGNNDQKSLWKFVCVYVVWVYVWCVCVRLCEFRHVHNDTHVEVTCLG